MNLRTVRIFRVSLVVLASLTLNRVVEAQDAVDKSADAMAEPLITDRPDFTESTDAIPAGHFQLEAGYTFTYDREHTDRVRDHAAPEFLLRIGVIDDVELRLGWQGYSWTENQFVTATPAGRRARRRPRSAPPGPWSGLSAPCPITPRPDLCACPWTCCAGGMSMRTPFEKGRPLMDSIK